MIINTAVGFKLNITFVVIDKASDIIKNKRLSLFKFLPYSGNKFFYQISGIPIIDLVGTGDSSRKKSVIMVKVPVKGYLLDRWIKSVSAPVNSGRRIVTNKSAKTRDNNTIMPK